MGHWLEMGLGHVAQWIRGWALTSGKEASSRGELIFVLAFPMLFCNLSV